MSCNNSVYFTGPPGNPGPKGEPGDSLSAPEVIVSPASLTVTQNQTATFYCSADGNPKPSVSWSKKGGAGLVNTDGQDNKLQIRSAGYNDSGSYVCTAKNILDESKKEVKLFVEGELLEKEKYTSVNPIQTGEGGWGWGGGRKVPALTLNVYNFFKIQPNAAKLYEFF